MRDGAIVYEDLDSAADLPIGWTDDQDAGRYRLERRDDEARFGYAVGPHSWKQFLLPPRIRLWRAQRQDDGFEVEEEPLEDRPLALIGVRACELHGIAIQDKVLLGGRYADRDYAARRKDAFVVAVNCFEPAGTCFCVSMGTGPKADVGLRPRAHRDPRRRPSLPRRGRQRARRRGSPRPAAPRRRIAADLEAAGAAVAGAAEKMGRQVDTTDIRDLLARNLEHERWDDVAERCLTCGNCTLVCPTCFCTSVEDVTDLTGEHAERTRSWDSCFSRRPLLHPRRQRQALRPLALPPVADAQVRHLVGPVRHSGCIGCGRCITWCPVGIDVTEELTAIRASEGADDGDD